MKGQKSIQVNIASDRMVFNISEKTTCEDVIKMASRNSLLNNSKSKDFAIFESAFGVSKMLSGQTKLLKQIRTWGEDEDNFSLEMKETDKVKSKMASIKRAKTKLQRIRELLKKHEMKDDQKFESCLYDNLVSNAKSKTLYNKNISCLDESSKIKNITVKANGKKELIQRYLNDSIRNKDYIDIYLPARTPGVGCEFDNVLECELPVRTRGDGEESLGYSTESDDNVHDMNTAFISNKTLNINVLSNTDDELNEAKLYDHDITYSDDDESAFEEDSDCYESVCELERNVIENENTYIQLNELKRIFSNDDLNARISDDDLLDSFMNTFVHDDDSDEGRGSVYSDFE